MSNLLPLGLRIKFDESQHPRDEAGRFTDGGGGGESATGNASPAEFIAARDANKRAAFMSPLHEDDLKGKRVFLNETRDVGYVLDADGDLGNLFNNSDRKGEGTKALVSAIKNGAKTLDCFDGFLPNLYAKYGFKVTGRMRFVDEYAPPGWDFDRNGRPDVVFMAYQGGDRDSIEQRKGTFGSYEPTEGGYLDDYDDAKAQSRAASESGGSRPGRKQAPGGTGGEGGSGERRIALRLSDGASGLLSEVLKDFDPNQPRAEDGKWTSTGAGSDPSNTLKDPHEPGITPEEKHTRLTRQDEHEWKKKLDDPSIAPKDRPMPERLFQEKLKDYEQRVEAAKTAAVPESLRAAVAEADALTVRLDNLKHSEIDRSRTLLTESLEALGIEHDDAVMAANEAIADVGSYVALSPHDAAKMLALNERYAERFKDPDEFNKLTDTISNHEKMRTMIQNDLYQQSVAARQKVGEANAAINNYSAKVIDQIDAEMGIEFHYARMKAEANTPGGQPQEGLYEKTMDSVRGAWAHIGGPEPMRMRFAVSEALGLEHGVAFDSKAQRFREREEFNDENGKLAVWAAAIRIEYENTQRTIDEGFDFAAGGEATYEQWSESDAYNEARNEAESEAWNDLTNSQSQTLDYIKQKDTDDILEWARENEDVVARVSDDPAPSPYAFHDDVFDARQRASEATQEEVTALARTYFEEQVEHELGPAGSLSRGKYGDDPKYNWETTTERIRERAMSTARDRLVERAEEAAIESLKERFPEDYQMVEALDDDQRERFEEEQVEWLLSDDAKYAWATESDQGQERIKERFFDSFEWDDTYAFESWKRSNRSDEEEHIGPDDWPLELYRAIHSGKEGYVPNYAESWSKGEHVVSQFGSQNLIDSIDKERILVYQGAPDWKAREGGMGTTELEFIVLSQEPKWVRAAREKQERERQEEISDTLTQQAFNRAAAEWLRSHEGAPLPSNWKDIWRDYYPTGGVNP